ncbi:MAG: HDIG domain-containing metalloprotein [Smithellaceae bacterium]
MDFIDSGTKKANEFLKYFKGKNFLSLLYPSDPLYQRWTIAVVLCLLLSVILAPDVHLFAPKYKIGMISPADIKADRDFLVEDLESTKQKRNEAARDVKSVYDYDRNIAGKIKDKLARTFNVLNEFRPTLPNEVTDAYNENDMQEEQKAKKLLEQILGFSLSAEEFRLLISHKNPVKLQHKLNRLVSTFYENNNLTNAVFMKSEKEKGIILRNLETQAEEEMKDISQILNIRDIDPLLEKRVNAVFSNEYNGNRRTILSFSKKCIEPNLTFNKEATEKKKALIMEDVKPVFFQVQRGEMIVREGEKINPVELAKLNAFYKVTGDNRFPGISVIVGIFCTTLFLCLVLYFWRTRNWLKKTRVSNADLLAFGLIVILQIIFIKIGIFMSSAVNRAFPFISVEACYFAIPFAMGSMIIAILINRNVALIMAVLTSFLVGFLYDEKMIFPLFSFLGSVAASHHIVKSRHRSALLKVGILLGVVNMASILCLNLVSGNFFNDLIWRLATGFFGGILTGVFVAGITPVFESIFGFMTDIKLLELANLNQPVFQRMIIEAPGTYHHSIVVASLVEAASEAIGANSVLAKVAAYYHDIGKLKKPQYFIENQPKNENKHEKLSPKMSSLIIISHVKDGCELASEAKLGRQIIDIIRQSHGTSIVSFFYDKAKKDKDESIRSLSESDFRYHGPRPQTKEAGLVMLGDVVEASSRTLTNPTPARIRSLVRERIERVYTDGQLDDCELTLQNLSTIAETFTRILTGIFHQRIDYPADQHHKDAGSKKENHENTNRQ